MKLDLGDLKHSEYLRIRIEIETEYKWGDGWGKNFPENARAFDNETYDKLTKLGFKYEWPKDEMSCPHIKMPEREKFKKGGKMDLYLHPMEITGIATREQIDKIVMGLTTCKTIGDIAVTRSEPIYDLNERQYENILAKNSKNILEWMKDYYKKNKGETYDVGFDFAKENRFDATCLSGAGLSSMDVDINFIEHFNIIAKELGLYDGIEIKKEQNRSYGEFEKYMSWELAENKTGKKTKGKIKDKDEKGLEF